MCGPRGGREDRPLPSRPPPRGSKHHVICDGQGIPLAVTLTAANRNDITELLPLVDRVPPTGRHASSARRRCSPTEPTTAESTGKPSGSAASHRGSPNAHSSFAGISYAPEWTRTTTLFTQDKTLNLGLARHRQEIALCQ